MLQQALEWGNPLQRQAKSSTGLALQRAGTSVSKGSLIHFGRRRHGLVIIGPAGTNLKPHCLFDLVSFHLLYGFPG